MRVRVSYPSRHRIATGVLVAAMVGACTSSSPSPNGLAGSQQDESTTQDELTIALASLGNEALDPILGPANNDRYLDLIYDSLIGRDYAGATLSEESGIAEAWTVSDDGLVYTFQLRPWQFHNGVDVTAEDFKFSLDRLGDPAAINGLAPLIASSIATVEVLGPLEVAVTLNEPRPNFLLTISSMGQEVKLVSKSYFDEVGPDAFSREPIGSGPYRLVEREVGASMSFEKAYDEHFSIGVPRFERITMRLVPEESTRVAMLQSGEADFIDVSIPRVRALEDSGFTAYPRQAVDGLVVLFQWFRSGEATADVNLRRALSLAIDREVLNDALFDGLGQISGTVFNNLQGLEPLPPPEYDVEEARALMEETDYGEDGEDLTLHMQIQIREGWPQLLQIGAAIQADWAEIGVDSEIVYRDYGAFRPEWASHTMEAPSAHLFNQPGPPAWQPNAVIQFTCEGVLSNACDPQLDRLIEEWGTAATEDEALAKAGEAEQLIADQYYSIQVLAAPAYFIGNEQIQDSFSAGYQSVSMNPRALAWDFDGQ